jgi:site-specific recombinase XerD
MERKIGAGQLAAFRRWLLEEEREPATIEKYLREVRAFAAWLEGAPVTKEGATAWKARLTASGFQPGTVNGKLSALNKFFAFLGWPDCRVKYLKIQRRVFRSSERELSREEYTRLLETARVLGRERLALLIETICATGIRVSELKYITVESMRNGRTEISLKGKIRTILIPGKLCRKLLKYARKRKIASGEIFLTRSGKSLSRRQIWAEMKALCARAGVERSKVFPHNLRHLFARTFYRACRDVVKLADVLGHSSIETTRIYLISTGAEHARQLERLGLVS